MRHETTQESSKSESAELGSVNIFCRAVIEDWKPRFEATTEEPRGLTDTHPANCLGVATVVFLCRPPLRTYGSGLEILLCRYKKLSVCRSLRLARARWRPLKKNLDRTITRRSRSMIGNCSSWLGVLGACRSG
jgi:hypothetical protein